MTKVTNNIIEAVDASKLTGALPAVDGSALTNLPAGGITEADMWRVTADFSGNASPISTNLARVGTDFAVLGTGMSHVNGIFSFPSVGHWKIEYHMWMTSMNHSQGNGGYIRTSQNAGASWHWTNASRSGIYKFSAAYPSEGMSFATCIFNVTDIAQARVSFIFGAGQGLEVCKAVSYTHLTLPTKRIV